MDILESLNWRYATKKFDPTKKISSENIETLKQVLQLTPSSYGLQPWKFLIIENAQIREQLLPHSWNQSQVKDASHLIVFCSYTDITDDFVDNHINLTSNLRNIDSSNLQGYGDFVKKTMKALSAEEKTTWNSKQAYIALGQFLFACAQLKIDATPMEGFDAAKYDELLGLKEKGLKTTLICPIGYRSAEDAAQHTAKVRRRLDDIIEII